MKWRKRCGMLASRHWPTTGLDGMPAPASGTKHFLRADGQVMVATIAVGMGSTSPTCGFVAHLDMPKNIEGYYQETGRDGTGQVSG